MKKKKMFISFMALAVLFAVAQMAMAYTVTTGANLGPYTSAGGGGEFSVKPGGGLEGVLSYYAAVAKDFGPLAGSFQTFCLEKDEFITTNRTYDVVLNNAAVAGGIGGPSPDPVSIGTAELFYRFATNDWSSGPGYDYSGASRVTDAGALQDAIWYLEQEIQTIAATNKYYNYVFGKYGAGVGDPNLGHLGQFPVMAMNLYYNGAVEQDQLTVVPIPAAAWLLGSGLIGLVAVRRRVKK